MIDVHYFASIREALESEGESLTLPESEGTVSALVDHLITLHDERWANTLRDSSVLVAINQTVAKYSSVVHDGDEVAFFPPVTGG